MAHTSPSSDRHLLPAGTSGVDLAHVEQLQVGTACMALVLIWRLCVLTDGCRRNGPSLIISGFMPWANPDASFKKILDSDTALGATPCQSRPNLPNQRDCCMRHVRRQECIVTLASRLVCIGQLQQLLHNCSPPVYNVVVRRSLCMSW